MVFNTKIDTDMRTKNILKNIYVTIIDLTYFKF